jgi:hypothetical protein
MHITFQNITLFSRLPFWSEEGINLDMLIPCTKYGSVMHKPSAYSMMFQYHANQGIIFQIIKVKTPEDHLACHTMNSTDRSCRVLLYLSETDSCDKLIT